MSKARELANLGNYEEGSWTPILRSDAGNDYQNTARGGRYVKTGSQVTVSFYFKRNTATIVGGNMLLYGLPFAVLQNSGSYPQPIGSFSVGAAGDGILRNGPSGFGALTTGNLIYFTMYGNNSNTLYQPSASTAADVITFQATYITS
jgi:hypothetical protein